MTRLLLPGVVDDGPIEHIETHIAHVFVGPNRTIKIKRAVKLPFLDFSTIERRRLACFREFEINAPHAPDLYLGVLPITLRERDSVAVGGPGAAIDWAVAMRSFQQRDLLSRMAAEGRLTVEVLKATADMVAALHGRSAVVAGTDAAAKMRQIVCDVAAACRACPGWPDAALIDGWAARAGAAVDRHAALLVARAGHGRVRRCHGDLHLANVVIWNGRPTPFDAIEFSDEIATVDTLYDLAFLLMDMEHRLGRAAANVVMNRYLWRMSNDDEIAGLALLGLFMSARAAIRAMVTAERYTLTGDGSAELPRQAVAYLRQAVDALEPARLRLVAVGGLSGTGKSTLAAALAPLTGEPSGALHLRSDLERKALAGVEETERLPPESYTRHASDEVYARMLRRAGVALAAGRSVIVDAVFAHPAERRAAQDLAIQHGACFDGVWLTAETAVLRARVAARKADASDATPEVVEMQVARDVGEIDWQRIDAGGSVGSTLQRAIAVLGLPSRPPEAGDNGEHL